MKNIAVFASGTGSNFIAINQAILDKNLNANLVLLVSDKPKCKALKKAEELNINRFSFNPKEFNLKKHFEQEIVLKLKENNVELIVLAGYMRIIGETILKEYKNRIINIHPSYLPKFKGKDAIGQALLSRPKYTGVTVHYVDEGVDTGRIIEQVKINLLENETRETLEKRIHEIEHVLYPRVIGKLLEESL